MAVIQARKNKRGTTYQVLIRAKDGHPPKYKNYPTKQEAKDGQSLKKPVVCKKHIFLSKKEIYLTDLIDRYIEEILPSKPKNAKRYETISSFKTNKCYY